MGVPWRVAFALQEAGWYLRAEIIWNKPNATPEAVKDRPTRSHEVIFLLSKSASYYYDGKAIEEPLQHDTFRRYGKKKKSGPQGVWVSTGKTGRNKRSVWTVATRGFKGQHFATFPPDLVRPCILAGAPTAGRHCDCNVVIGKNVNPDARSSFDYKAAHDPSKQKGGKGWRRDRTITGGRHGQMTRGQQRHYAEQLRQSSHRKAMQTEAGAGPFSHYIRVDASGARTIPDRLLAKWIRKGWLLEAPRTCSCPVEQPGIVLDPFAGAGTTLLVAREEGRRSLGIELKPAYVEIIRKRLAIDVAAMAPEQLAAG